VRLVIDPNILVSALLAATSLLAQLLVLWRTGRFDLLTTTEQLDELMRATRYPKIRERLAPAVAGRLINDLRAFAVTLDKLSEVEVSADPDNDYLLALAAAGAADFLVTGDKRDLLGLAVYEGTKIITVRDFLAKYGRSARPGM
jgi:putative PIN family toxin of toxin-antitoxin system